MPILKGEGRQFNSFIYLPFPVKAITNWSVSVTFTNVVSDVEVWALVFYLTIVPQSMFPKKF